MKRNKRLTLRDVGERPPKYIMDAIDKIWAAINETSAEAKEKARNEEEAKRKETTEIDDWAEKHLIICGTD